MQVDKPKTKSIKALLCQIYPIIHQKTKNIKKVSISLENYSHKDQIDIIIFPETSFTGYNFQNYKDAAKQAIEYGKGQEFQFAIKLAKKCKCYVLFGYIQKAKKNEKEQVLYNSAAIIDREGKPIYNYRKTFLFYADKLWSQQGSGFGIIQITNTKGKKIKCALGICMDINSKDFTSGEYQLGDFLVQNQIQTLLFPTNWTDSQPQSTNEGTSLLNTYNYWMHRLRPVLTNEKKKQTLFLCADRVGKQYVFWQKKQGWFNGGTCAIMLNPNYLIKNLGKRNQGYLMIQTQLPDL